MYASWFAYDWETAEREFKAAISIVGYDLCQLIYISDCIIINDLGDLADHRARVIFIR